MIMPPIQAQSVMPHLPLMVLFTTCVISALVLGYYWALRQHLMPLRRQLQKRLQENATAGEPAVLLQDEALSVLQEIRDQAENHGRQIKAELKSIAGTQAAEKVALRDQYLQERDADRNVLHAFKAQVRENLEKVSGFLGKISQTTNEAAHAATQSTEFQREVARMIAEQRKQLSKLESGIQYDLMSLAFSPVFDIYDELQNLKRAAAEHTELQRLVESLERSLHNTFDALRLEPVRFNHGDHPSADPDRLPPAVWEPNPQAIEAPEPHLAGHVARQSTTGFRIAASPTDQGEVRVLRRAIVTLYRSSEPESPPQSTSPPDYDPVQPDASIQSDQPSVQPTEQPTEQP